MAGWGTWYMSDRQTPDVGVVSRSSFGDSQSLTDKPHLLIIKTLGLNFEQLVSFFGKIKKVYKIIQNLNVCSSSLTIICLIIIQFVVSLLIHKRLSQLRLL